MKKKFTIVLIAAATSMFAAGAWAQSLAKVMGKASDLQGKAIVGATVEFANADTGQKYNLKTDKKGEYFSIGIQPGTYKTSLIEDGKVVFFFNSVPVQLSDEGTRVDFNLAKEQAASQAAAGAAPGAAPTAQQLKKLTPEQQKQLADIAKKNEVISKENANIKVLNEKLAQAAAAEQTGNWDQAVATMNEATALDPNRDLLWARLGEAQLGAGGAAKNKDEATQHYAKAAEAYQKAVQLKPADGKYHNNLGQAFAKSGKPKEALAEYTTAAQSDPTDAAMYYFNLGAILTNQATREADQTVKTKDINEANTAFDKAITAKPDYSEAWYQKGINLTSKMTIDKSGKLIPAPGTVESFNKYLELDPTGKHAEEAKGLLQGFGETVQTSYKKTKATKK